MRPLYFRAQVCRFVTLFVGRAGSNYLQRSLNCHPRVVAVGEELAARREQGAGAQNAWLRAFLAGRRLGRTAARGFRAKHTDVLDPDVFRLVLYETHCKVIYLQRRNRIKAVISRINAERLWEQTQRWQLFDEQDRPPPMTVEPQRFHELLEHREQVDRDLRLFVQSLERPTLELFYEDLLCDQPAVLSRAFEFLGVDYFPGHTDTLKNTSDNLRDVIVNFDTLRAGYAGTAYEAMFDEGLQPVPVR